MLYNSVFIFDAAITSLIIDIGPRSTQRILGSHRKMIGHYSSYIYIYTHTYTHNFVCVCVCVFEHTCDHIRAPIKETKEKLEDISDSCFHNE